MRRPKVYREAVKAAQERQEAEPEPRPPCKDCFHARAEKGGQEASCWLGFFHRRPIRSLPDAPERCEHFEGMDEGISCEAESSALRTMTYVRHRNKGQRAVERRGHLERIATAGKLNGAAGGRHCDECGEVLTPNPFESRRDFNQRRYCNRACAARSQWASNGNGTGV